MDGSSSKVSKEILIKKIDRAIETIFLARGERLYTYTLVGEEARIVVDALASARSAILSE